MEYETKSLSCHCCGELVSVKRHIYTTVANAPIILCGMCLAARVDIVKSARKKPPKRRWPRYRALTELLHYDED